MTACPAQRGSPAKNLLQRQRQEIRSIDIEEAIHDSGLCKVSLTMKLYCRFSTSEMELPRQECHGTLPTVRLGWLVAIVLYTMRHRAEREVWAITSESEA